jgi:hypothetical protein
MSRKIVNEKLNEKDAKLHAEFRISVISRICTLCNHFNRESPIRRRCKAFPEGIPLEIWKGENDHTQPFDDDNGILYKKYIHKNPRIEDLEIEIFDGKRRFKNYKKRQN